ncbi:MAG: hypothetical protein EB003_07565 [Flavobacteriia bacterium]|nr:hypothetical protein [Flavobacteriia bacterium]
MTVISNGIQCTNTQDGVTKIEYFALKIIYAFIAIENSRHIGKPIDAFTTVFNLTKKASVSNNAISICIERVFGNFVTDTLHRVGVVEICSAHKVIAAK